MNGPGQEMGEEGRTDRRWWAADAVPGAGESPPLARPMRVRRPRPTQRPARRRACRLPVVAASRRTSSRPPCRERPPVPIAIVLLGGLLLTVVAIWLLVGRGSAPALAATGATVGRAGPAPPSAAPAPTQRQRYPAAPGGPTGGPGEPSPGDRFGSSAAPPPPVLATGPTASVPLPGVPIPNPLDPEQWTKWAKDLFNALVVQFFTGILEAIRGIVGALFGALGTNQDNLLVPIPAALTYDHPVVRQYQGLLIGAANAGLACVLALGGVNVMFKDRIGATYHDAMELLPRFMVGAAFINLSRQPGEFLIDFANAAIAGVGATGAPGWGALPADVKTIGDVLLAIFYLVALLCLVLQVYLRLVLVDLLLILTPLAMLAWILPQTQEIARRWTNALVSTVAVFFVQSLALKVGAALLQAGLTDTSGTGALASLFLGGAFFVLLFRLPGMVSQHSGGGTVGRVLLARLAMGALSRGGAGARGRA